MRAPGVDRRLPQIRTIALTGKRERVHEEQAERGFGGIVTTLPSHDPLSLTPSDLTFKDGYRESLEQRGTLPAQAHVFERASIEAVNGALAAHRPLLVRGESGRGKSQLAPAAQYLKRPLVTKIGDSRTEARDLLWEFAVVARLAEAELIGVLQRASNSPSGTESELRARLEPPRLVVPLSWQIG